MKFPARVLGLLFAFLLVFFVSKVSFAQTNYNAQQYQAPNVNSNVPKNLHFWTQNVMLEVMSSMICQLAGIDPSNPNQACLGIDRKTGKIGFVKNGGGAIGVTGSLIAGTFLIPVHFSDYATYAVNNFGFPKKSYAQNTGIGYTGLQPVVGLFTIFRNIAYLLMVFVFVIIGVAIMLRLRIDPRTVMTIQNQIPKLIIGLVMITFSYAIVGLLIDAMWISTYFAVNTLTPTGQRALVVGGITQSAPGFAQAVLAGEGGIIGLAAGGASGVGDLVRNTLQSPQISDALKSPQAACDTLDFGCKISDMIGGAIGSLLSTVFGWIISVLATVIVFFIFIIAILVALFKLLFALIKSFVTILLDTILAPFWILGGLLPGAGQSIGIGPWLRDVVANLAVFPAVVFLFLVAKVIMDGLQDQANVATNFNPPLIGNATAQNASNFAALIAVGFILAAPGVVDSVKKALKASGGVGLGGAAVGAAAAGAVGGAIGSRLYYRDPRTGETRGPLANAQKNVTSKISNSRVGSAVGNFAPIRAVKQSRFAGSFKPPQPKPTTKTPEQLAKETEAAEKARRQQADSE